MFIPDPLNGFVLNHDDFKGSFDRLDKPTKDLIIEMTGCMILRDGSQPDGSWGSVRINSTQLRDALAFVATCLNA